MSTGKFADIVRKLFKMTPPLKRGTMKEWDEWEKTSKKENPFIYWFLGDFLSKVQDIAYAPYELFTSFRIYIKNRFFDKTHTLQTRLKKGQYWETDDKILHGCFEALVDFVEVETTTMMLWCYKEESKKYWRYRFKPLRFKSIRSRELGLKYLRFSMNETDHEIERCAKDQEIIKLYLWWKDERPSRVDPYSDEVWSMDLETAYYEEDTEKLKQLVSIRGTLWT